MHFLVKNKYITDSELSQQCYSLLKIKELLFSETNNKQLINRENNQMIAASSKNNGKNIPSRMNNPGGQSFRQPNYSNRNYSNNFRKPYSRGGYYNNDSGFPPLSNHYDRFPPPPNNFDMRYPPHFDSRYPSNHPNNYEIRDPSVQYSESGMNRNNWPAPPIVNYEYPVNNVRNLPNVYHNRDPRYYNSDQRYNPDQFNRFKNNRNRKEYDNNISKMENLNISDKMPSMNYSDSDESIQHKDVKKCRLESESARTKLDLIQNECHFNLDNSKQQLNIFFQINRIKADYEYSSFGPAHLR